MIYCNNNIEIKFILILFILDEKEAKKCLIRLKSKFSDIIPIEMPMTLRSIRPETNSNNSMGE